MKPSSSGIRSSSSRTRGNPPGLGEHTRAALSEQLGFGVAEPYELREQQIIYFP